MNSKNRASRLFFRIELHREEKLLEVGPKVNRIGIQEAYIKKV